MTATVVMTSAALFKKNRTRRLEPAEIIIVPPLGRPDICLLFSPIYSMLRIPYQCHALLASESTPMKLHQHSQSAWNSQQLIATMVSQHSQHFCTTLAFVSICHLPPSNLAHDTQLPENVVVCQTLKGTDAHRGLPYSDSQHTKKTDAHVSCPIAGQVQPTNVLPSTFVVPSAWIVLWASCIRLYAWSSVVTTCSSSVWLMQASSRQQGLPGAGGWQQHEQSKQDAIP